MRHGSGKYISCPRRNTARKWCWGKSGGTGGLYLQDLARRKECRIEEGHLMRDHVQADKQLDPMQLKLPSQ